MATTPNASFSTITLLPGWGVEYSVNFRNNERLLGNNFLSITDGGNNNPEELVSLTRLTTATAIDTTIADLRSFQGSTAFNWRFFPGGNYKLYFCTSFSEQSVGAAHKSIAAELSRHPDSQYDPQPATVADGVPWGTLTQPIRWGATQATESTPLITEYSKGEVQSRRPQSIFTAQNTKSTWTVEFPNISSSRLTAIEFFLKQRRGRIPFQFSPTSNFLAKLWICSRWSVRLMGQNTATAADMRYSMSLELRQVFRAAPVNAIGGIPVAAFTTSSATIAEGAATTYTVSLSSASLLTVTIPFALSGSASNGTDYTITPSPLTITAGSTTATITVTSLTDAASEGNETVIIALGTPTNATLGTPNVATTTITNVAPALPTVSLSAASASVAEGSSTSYTLTLSSVSASTVTVPYTLSGTATPTGDYTITSSPLTIAPGNLTTTLTIAAVTDAASEGNETATVTLGTPTNATLGAITACTTTITNVASGGEDAIVTDWANRTVTAGGAVSTATRSAMDIYVKGCKTDLIWTKLSSGVIIPFASDAFAGVFTPLIIPSGRSLTNNNFVGGDYSLTTGLDPGSTNTTKFISSSVLVSDVFTSTNIHVSIYQNLIRGNGGYAIYNNDGNQFPVAGSRIVLYKNESGFDRWDAFNATTGSGRLSAASTGSGFLTASRTGTTSVIYKNGTSQASGTLTGGTFPSSNPLSMLGLDTSRTNHLYFGAALTASEELLHYNRVQALQTALGRQIGTAEDAIVTDWVSRVVAAGGAVATATRNAMDVYVKGLKADNIYTKMSTGFIMPFASDGWSGAMEPLFAPSGATFTPTLLTSSDYALLTGIDPGSANTDPKRITTNINAQSIFTQTNVQCSVYHRIYRVARDASVNTINGSDVQNRLQFHAPWENGIVSFDAFSFDEGAGRLNATLSTNTGLITGARDASGVSIYRNGSVQATSTSASTLAVPNATINLIGCFDSGFSFYSRSTTAYIYAGAVLTASEEALHYSRVQTLQTSLGRQI